MSADKGRGDVGRSGAPRGGQRPAGTNRRAGAPGDTTSRRAPERRGRRVEQDTPGPGDRRGRPARPRDAGDARPPEGGSPEPALGDEIEAATLDRGARARLRGLSKENADRVARHLVAAGMLLDGDPEAAYQHAMAAQRRAGRVDVVREAVGLTAYATGRYAEALRELRTARRLSGLDAHRAVEADCERALGRPERALALARAPEVRELSVADQVELAIVASGARVDLGEPDAALAVLDEQVRALAGEGTSGSGFPDLAGRVAVARADVLQVLGRDEEAAAALAAAGLPAGSRADESVVVVDLAENAEPEDPSAERRGAPR